MYLSCRNLKFLVISHLGFYGRNFVLIAPVPGHCLPFAYCKVAEWPHFGERAARSVGVCSRSIMYTRNFSYFSFGCEGGTWVLIAPVPGHCFSFT